MEWKLDKNRPICPQLCEQLCAHIANKVFLPNQRLMSVREIALSAGVNPNTVQRSFENLERDGILYSVRGSGWYVAEDITAAEKAVKDLAREKTAEYFNAMSALGISESETKKIVEEWKV